MSITIEEVVALQHDQLRTIGAKIVYLTIRNNAQESGWAAISLAELARNTSLSRQGIIKTLKRMAGCGLIEVRNDKVSTTSRNKYRTVEL